MLEVFDFPIDSAEIHGKTIQINDTSEEIFTQVDLYDDEDAFIYDNELSFDKNEEDVLQLIWKGNIDDFYTGSEKSLPFRLKCEFKQDEILVDED